MFQKPPPSPPSIFILVKVAAAASAVGFLLLTPLTHVTETEAHIRLRHPPQRSSVWRDKAYNNRRTVSNYDDFNVNCGGVYQEGDFADCGICGDSLNASTPRDHERGGKYGQGIIVGRYEAGQEVEVGVEVQPTHLGYFHFQICDEVPETEACFQDLFFANGDDRQEVNTLGGERPRFLNTTIVLPADLRCQKCVLRIQYLGGSNWGMCPDRRTAGTGCGPQEAFRNCADISIS